MPTTKHIDMDLIVDYVRAAGYVAYVEQTGGGVATIYASRTADERGYPARHPVGPYNDDVVDVAAGPGWFEGPAWTMPRGDLADFYVGPDGDDFDDYAKTYRATESDTANTLGARIVALLAGQS